jgi:hypothetical protein
MDGYLSKPIRAKELDALLENYVSLGAATQPAAEPEGRTR